MPLVEMKIDSIRVSLLNHQRVVILKEKGAERYLPIWIGPAEADAIAIKLQGITPPRPLTHDLLTSVISALGARVEAVLVNDLRNDTFYAKIFLVTTTEERLEIDSRPSDAMALAVRTGAPIYVEESVLLKAGIAIDKETGKPVPLTEVEKKKGEVSEEEMEKLSPFREVLDNLNLDDLGKSS